MADFIPALHFKTPEEKLTPEWCNEVVDYYFRNTRLKNLLYGKNVSEIEGYANGTYSMRPYKRMYASMRAQHAKSDDLNVNQRDLDRMDNTGIDWTQRAAAIVPKLTAAVNSIVQTPKDVKCSAVDALAQKKKSKDLEFLKNYDKMTAFLQPLYDSMALGEVDLGTTQHNDIPFKKLPMGLNADDDSEFDLFSTVLYNLAPCASYEILLQAWIEYKKFEETETLTIKDQYKFGVSALRAFSDKNTSLPNHEYLHPSSVATDGGNVPDHSDDTVRIVDIKVTPMELFKYFPDEICNEEQLEKIVNLNGGDKNWGNGYCVGNNLSPQKRSNWDTFKMTLKQVEIKSVDATMIAQKGNSKYGSFRYFTNDPKKCVDRVWAGNTYTFYWLYNTKYFFGIDRLDYAHRSKGIEVQTGFSTIIYRSCEKSAVELSIGENVKLQQADIKLQHAIIMARPAGVVVDMKYIRAAADAMEDQPGNKTALDILERGVEQGTFVIDSEGFEGKSLGQFLPIKDIPGGLRDDINGYYKVFAEANNNIYMYMNSNPNFSGLRTEDLNGLQTSALNQALNGQHHIYKAVITQRQALANIWGYYFQQAIKSGGAARQAIINVIGTTKERILRGLDESPMHDLRYKITIGAREEERQLKLQQAVKLNQQGVISAYDLYLVESVLNPRDAMLLIAERENKFQQKLDQQKKDALVANQQMVQQQGQNAIQNTQAQMQAKQQLIQAQTQADIVLAQAMAQLQLSQAQMDGMIKLRLQQDRNVAQKDKSLSTLGAKNALENQQSFA